VQSHRVPQGSVRGGGGPGSMSSVEVNKALLDCKDVDEVVRLVLLHGECFSHVNTSTALLKLARLLPKASRHVVGGRARRPMHSGAPRAFIGCSSQLTHEEGLLPRVDCGSGVGAELRTFRELSVEESAPRQNRLAPATMYAPPLAPSKELTGLCQPVEGQRGAAQPVDACELGSHEGTPCFQELPDVDAALWPPLLAALQLLMQQAWLQVCPSIQTARHTITVVVLWRRARRSAPVLLSTGAPG
jgi:hypothetical protein